MKKRKFNIFVFINFIGLMLFCLIMATTVIIYIVTTINYHITAEKKLNSDIKANETMIEFDRLCIDAQKKLNKEIDKKYGGENNGSNN